MWITVFLALVALLASLLWWIDRKVKASYDYETFMRLPGPKPLPIIGNTLLFVGASLPEQMQVFGSE